MNNDYTNPDIWRTVSGHPRYMVSCEGDVVELTDGGVIPVKKFMDDLGYECVEFLGPNGNYIMKDVCRLVASAFLVNPDAYEYDDLRHIDGDLKNNTIANLEYVNVHENPDDDIRHELYCKNGTERRASYRLPIVCQNVDTGEVQRFESITEAENALGLTGIRHVLKGRRTKCKNYIFWYDS